MGFVKKLEKAITKNPLLTGALSQSPFGGASFGSLADHLRHEDNQHEMHDKVKEIHHHYHDKKEK